LFRLFLLVVALILYGSLYPWHFNFSRYSGDPLDFLLFHSWPDVWTRGVMRDLAANVLFYTPLGASAFLMLARRRRRAFGLAGATILGFALSVAVEILQLYIPGRQTSLLDVLSNTTGALAGALLALAYRQELERTWARRHGQPVAAPAFLLACWIGHQLYPFFPFPAVYTFWRGLVALLHPASISGIEVWANAAEWLAAAVAIDAILHGGLPSTSGRLRWHWLAIAMLCLPLRIVIVGRRLPFEAALGALLALLVWRVLPPPGRRNAAVGALASAILLRELAPLRFAATPAAFSWIPFAASLESNRQAGIIVLLQKAYDYGAMVWLLRLGGLRYARAAALVAAALAICEGAQRYLPGRTPESTDPLLALLMALVLWALSGIRQPDRGKSRMA
jgi:VanZ family protein